MRTFILVTVIFLWWLMDAKASTIILKDGQTITGDIVKQDKNKVIVKAGEMTLTYFRDEIASVNDGALIVKDHESGSDEEMGKLIDQYNSLFPMENFAINWTKTIVPKEQTDYFLSYLRKNSGIERLNEFRKKEMMKYFSPAELKAAVVFFASPEGRKYHEDLTKYNIATFTAYRNFVRTEATEAMRQLNTRHN
jgi:hypothetical protein